MCLCNVWPRVRKGSLFCSLVCAASFSILTYFQRQSLARYLANPHYGSLINADGHAEVWTDWNDMSKFCQYGWRCTTNENAYSNHTLMGNWNQERYDLRNIVQPKPLPSQVIQLSLLCFLQLAKETPVAIWESGIWQLPMLRSLRLLSKWLGEGSSPQWNTYLTSLWNWILYYHKIVKGWVVLFFSCFCSDFIHLQKYIMPSISG